MPKEMTAEDLTRGYNNAYFMYDGEMVFANTAGNTLYLYKVVPGGQVAMDRPLVEIDFNQKKWKNVALTCPELGWLPFNNSLVYLERTSRRQWKYGLHGSNMQYYRFTREVLVNSGAWQIVDSNWRAALLKKNNQYVPGMAIQWLSKEYVINNNVLYSGIYPIGAKVGQRFDLEEGADDSLTVRDLMALGVPLNV